MRTSFVIGLMIAFAALSGCDKTGDQQCKDCCACDASQGESPASSGKVAVFSEPTRVHPQAPNPSSVPRERFYHLGEGSELFPLSWMRALNGPGGSSFMDDANLERYGLISDPASGENKHALPIGMSLGAAANPALTGFEVVGFNCAACHVGRMHAEGLLVTLDGAPNMFDIKLFNREVGEAFGRLRNPREALAFLRRLYDRPRARGEAESRSSMIDQPAELTLRLYRQLPPMEQLEAGNELERMLAADLADTVAREFAAADGMSFEQLRRAHKGEKARPPLPAQPKSKARSGGPAPDKLSGRIPGEQLITKIGVDVTAKQRSQFASEKLRSALAAGELKLDFVKDAPRDASARSASVFDLITDLAETIRWIAQRVKFLKQLESVAEVSENTLAGPGRVDAFTSARNLMYGIDNALPTESPICYPHLWGFSKVRWLHWDANTTSVMERNIGQALGLGAAIKLPEHESSVQVRNIHELEQFAKEIPVPVWPFAKPDAEQVTNGKELFVRYCNECHAPGISAAEDAGIDDVGTDSIRVRAFNAPLNGRPFVEVLSETLKKVKEEAFKREGVDAGEFGDDPGLWRETKGYAKRSLEGIWASAPYLHNGSVPTLADLLEEPAKRPQTFWIGSRRYDTERVGYVTDAGPFNFQTCKPGNSNLGHAFGTELSADQKRALIAYMKTL